MIQSASPAPTPAPTPRLAGLPALTAVRGADGRLVVLHGGPDGWSSPDRSRG